MQPETASVTIMANEHCDILNAVLQNDWAAARKVYLVLGFKDQICAWLSTLFLVYDTDFFHGPRISFVLVWVLTMPASVKYLVIKI